MIKENIIRVLNKLTDKYAAKMALKCILYDNVKDEYTKDEMEFVALVCMSYARQEVENLLKELI